MTIDVVMDHQYAVDVLRVEVDHNQKNFLREAAKALATKLLEDGCIVTHDTYSIEKMAYHTTFTVLTGREARKLP